MGCSYGTLWANEEEIHIGEMGPSYGYCLELADDTCYKVSDISHECNDRIWVPLEEDEMLVIGMNWYDEDSGLGNSDDLQCEGYVAYTAHDFSDLVANQPNRRLTRAFWFSQNGGGTCGLKYIIYALEETPPSE
jgi:hypothetical protein